MIYSSNKLNLLKVHSNNINKMNLLLSLEHLFYKLNSLKIMLNIF